MIQLYRRHSTQCIDDHGGRDPGRKYRRCSCPIYAEGSVGSETIRESLNLTSWKAATAKVQAWEAAGTMKTKAVVEIDAALDSFVTDCGSRNLSYATNNKYKFLVKTLKEYCRERTLRTIDQVDVNVLSAFRSKWKDSPLSATKKLERLKAIFRFLQEREMIERDPAKPLKPPISHHGRVEPFSPDEQKKILTTAYRLSVSRTKGKHGVLPPHPRTGTFAKLLLYTGLRITDAATLTKDRINDGRLFLYATKNKRLVTMPLPPDLLAELDAIPTHEYFPSPESSQRGETVSDYWRDQLIKVFDAAEIKNGHPHRFRHSLVMNMLLKGASIEDCALVIGDSPAIVAKHYNQFCQAKQARVDESLKKTWQETPAQLIRVK